MDAKDESERIGANEKEIDGPKKAYAQPKLTVHGSVEDITRAGGQNNTDALNGTPIG